MENKCENSDESIARSEINQYSLQVLFENRKLLKDKSEYRKPLFKFMKNQHADELLNKGNIYFPNINMFREMSTQGLISDKHEGSVFINYEGKHDLTLNVSSPYKIKNTINLKAVSWYQINNIYIYCTTDNILGDSLKWALNEDKDCCVLITNPHKFASIITQKYPCITLIDSSSCDYSGHEFWENNLNGILLDGHNFKKIFYLKDQKFLLQKEYRMVWTATDQHLTGQDSITCQVDPNLLGGLIKINYHGVKDIYSTTSTTRRVKIEVFNDSKQSLGTCEFEIPRSILTPIIHFYNGKECLGFYSDSTTYSNGKSSMPAIVNSLGFIWGAIPVDDISFIEYSYV